MPRLTNKPPSYSLHKPSGLAKVKYRGKITYLGKYGTRESREAYAEFITNLPKLDAPAEPAVLVAGAPLLVSEITLRYFRHAKQYYRKNGVPTGEHVTVRSALRPIEDKFGGLPANEFGPKCLKEAQQCMIALGWSRRYINKATSIIKRCFDWCVSEELIDVSTAGALKTVPGLLKGRTQAREKPPVCPVSDAHVDAVLPHVSDLVGAVIRVMRLTGARPSEAISLVSNNLDRSDPECWIYRPGQHKTEHHDKGRAIFIGPQAQAIIRPRLVKAGASGRVFPISRAGLRTAVERGCRRAGIPNWHPNQLRHSAATEFRAKFGLEAAQVLLGHSRADVTQVYAERDLEKARAVARKIG
jgi:integrase